MAEAKKDMESKLGGVAQLSSFDPLNGNKHPQEYYDKIKQKFAEERDLRLNYRPEGTAQFNSDFSGNLEHFGQDSYNRDVKARDTLNDASRYLSAPPACWRGFRSFPRGLCHWLALAVLAPPSRLLPKFWRARARFSFIRRWCIRA